MRWDASLYRVYAVVMVLFWLLATSTAAAAVDGSTDSPGGSSRLGNVLWAGLFFVVAASMTWLVVLFLRRPVVDDDSYRAAVGERRPHRSDAADEPDVGTTSNPTVPLVDSRAGSSARGTSRSTRLLLIGIGFLLTLTGVIQRSRQSSNEIPWWVYVLMLVAMVAWIWWRTTVISSRNVADSVAKFGAESGVFCRLVNDRVDQFGSLVVGYDGITWNPSERAVQAGCSVWCAATEEIVSVVTGRTSQMLRQHPTVTVSTTTSRPLCVAMPAKAQRTFMAAASSMGLPTSRAD